MHTQGSNANLEFEKEFFQQIYVDNYIEHTHIHTYNLDIGMGLESQGNVEAGELFLMVSAWFYHLRLIICLIICVRINPFMWFFEFMCCN